MNRSAVSSSTWVNSSSNWSITSSSCVPSAGSTRSQRARQPALAGELLEQRGGRSTATRSSAASSSSNGCGAGVISIGTSPRHRDAPRADRRQQPGPHHARLPAPARSDHRDEAAPGAGLAEPGDQPLDEPFAAEEVPGVGRAEGPQALVRVLGLGARPSGVVARCARSAARAPRAGRRRTPPRPVPPVPIGGSGPVDARARPAAGARPASARTRRSSR